MVLGFLCIGQPLQQVLFALDALPSLSVLLFFIRLGHLVQFVELVLEFLRFGLENSFF